MKPLFTSKRYKMCLFSFFSILETKFLDFGSSLKIFHKNSLTQSISKNTFMPNKKSPIFGNVSFGMMKRNRFLNFCSVFFSKQRIISSKSSKCQYIFMKKFFLFFQKRYTWNRCSFIKKPQRMGSQIFEILKCISIQFFSFSLWKIPSFVSLKRRNCSKNTKRRNFSSNFIQKYFFFQKNLFFLFIFQFFKMPNMWRQKRPSFFLFLKMKLLDMKTHFFKRWMSKYAFFFERIFQHTHRIYLQWDLNSRLSCERALS